MVTREQLQRFCEVDGRATLAHPWSDGVHTYASDGRIIVRVDRVVGGVVPQDPAALPHKKYAAVLFDKAMAGDWRARPAFPVEAPAGDAGRQVACQHCRGTGSLGSCQACDNEGVVDFVFEFRGTAHKMQAECPLCEGICGACHECDGTGKATDFESTVSFGAVRFGAYFVRLLAEALPGCTVRTNGQNEPAVIEFPGGVALLMPRRG